MMLTSPRHNSLHERSSMPRGRHSCHNQLADLWLYLRSDWLLLFDRLLTVCVVHVLPQESQSKKVWDFIKMFQRISAHIHTYILLRQTARWRLEHLFCLHIRGKKLSFEAQPPTRFSPAGSNHHDLPKKGNQVNTVSIHIVPVPFDFWCFLNFRSL